MSLVWLVLLPLLASAFCYQARERTAPQVARLATLITALMGLRVVFDPQGQSFFRPWFPQFGIHFDLAPQASVLPLLALGPMLVLGALTMLRPGLERRSEFCGHMLLMLACLQGLFLANNLGLFYVFFELMLVPALLLCARWGGERGQAVALKFFLYTMAGSLPMLLGILTLSLQGADGSLNFTSLSGLPPELQQSLFWLFALAFAVKTPLFPLHGWQLDFYRSAPAPVVAVVAALMSKAGVYGFLRILQGLFPQGCAEHGSILVGLALVSLLYGGVCALGAPCLRSILAYSSLSHLGLMTIAIMVGGELAGPGITLQMSAHAVSTGGLFLVLAALENRGFTSELSQLGGLARTMPSLAACALVLAMASLGCPGLASFPAELSMLMGIFRNSPALAALCSVGVVLAAWYGLRLYQGTFNGEHRQGPQHGDLVEDEWLAILPLVVLCFAFGLFPDFSLLQWTRGL